MKNSCKSIFLSLLMAAIGGVSGVSAQIAETDAPRQLLKGTHSELYNPVFSPDGRYLLFSAADYSRLRMYDFKDNVTVNICSDARSGLDAQFTADASEVVYVAQTSADNGSNLRQLRSYSVARGANTALAEPARSVGRPAVAVRGEGLAVSIDGRRHTPGRKAPSVAVRTEGSTLFIIRDGEEKAYTPVPSYAGYIWASVSPDASKVMFFAAGRGIVVTDLEGRVIAEPGKFEAPVWYGNSHIVAMNATDDGHQFESSQIVLLTLDGKSRQDLTAPESMTMNPAASIAAGKVVYNTIDGRLFEMNVRLK